MVCAKGRRDGRGSQREGERERTKKENRKERGRKGRNEKGKLTSGRMSVEATPVIMNSAKSSRMCFTNLLVPGREAERGQ